MLALRQCGTDVAVLPARYEPCYVPCYGGCYVPMQKKSTVWYTLGEAEKATNISRSRLDHACRVQRLQCRRSETGAQLLSNEVVEKLRQHGLKALPRPYDPVASANDAEVSPSTPTSGTAVTAQRERVEQKRGEIEEMRVSRDLRQLKDQEQQEKAERRATAAAERQAQAEQRAMEKRQRQPAPSGGSTPGRGARASHARSQRPRSPPAVGNRLAGLCLEIASPRCSSRLRTGCSPSRCRAST